MRELDGQYEYGLVGTRKANAIHTAYGREFDSQAHTRPIRPGDWFVALVRKSDGALAGYACILPQQGEERPSTLSGVFILQSFRNSGLGARFISALLQAYPVRVVEKPNEQVRSVLRRLGRTGPILYNLPSALVGGPDRQYLPLSIPFEDYPAFLLECRTWEGRLEHLVRLYGSLKAARRAPEGRLALDQLALAVLERINERGYAPGKIEPMRQMRQAAARAVERMLDEQKRRGVVWEFP